MIISAVSVILLSIFGYALIARKIAQSILSLPILSLPILSLPILISAIGYGLHLRMPEISQMHEVNEVILIIAEVTLVLVLFSDASRINFTGLHKYLSIFGVLGEPRNAVYICGSACAN